MADKGLIAASANLAKSRIPADIAGDFLKTFTAATDEMQKEQQAIQGEVAGYLGSLKTDIDFTSLSPEMEKQTRSYLATERSEYNDLANTVARVKDPSSKKYQDAVDRMNEIKRNFTTLASEIASYNQEKINTATDIDRSVYSKGVDPKDLAIQKNIYGLSENGMASMSIQNGHLNFNVDGSMVRYDKIKPLPMPSEVPMKIIENGATFSGYNRALTSEELKEQSAYLDNAIKDPSTLASVLFDHPSDLPLTVIAGEFATARKDGTLQEKMPDFIMRTKEAIINGYETSALEGKGRYDAQVSAKANVKPETQNFITLENKGIVSKQKAGVYNNIVNSTDALMSPGGSTDVPKVPPVIDLGTASSPYAIEWDINSKSWYHRDKDGVITDFESPQDIVVKKQALFK